MRDKATHQCPQSADSRCQTDHSRRNSWRNSWRCRRCYGWRRGWTPRAFVTSGPFTLRFNWLCVSVTPALAIRRGTVCDRAKHQLYQRKFKHGQGARLHKVENRKTFSRLVLLLLKKKYNTIVRRQSNSHMSERWRAHGDVGTGR